MQELVKEFMEKHKQYIAKYPGLPQIKELRELRKVLIEEEYREYLIAERDNDLIAIADALGDLLYVIFGAAIVYGIPLEEVFKEIHKSNMTKPVAAKRLDGKVVKGRSYKPPDINGIIFGNRHSL